MKIIIPLLVSLSLVSCAGFLSADQTKIQIQIITSKDKLFNVVTNDDQFKILSDKIAAEIQKRLLKRNIVSSTDEVINGEKFILTIEYEQLENDTFGLFSKNIYAMKGQFNIIDPKTQKVLLNGAFDEVEDKITDFVNSVSNKISNKILRYFK